MMDGKIVLSGDESLVTKIDQEGYDWIDAKRADEMVEKRPVSVASKVLREALGDSDD